MPITVLAIPAFHVEDFRNSTLTHDPYRLVLSRDVTWERLLQLKAIYNQTSDKPKVRSSPLATLTHVHTHISPLRRPPLSEDTYGSFDCMGFAPFFRALDTQTVHPPKRAPLSPAVHVTFHLPFSLDAFSLFGHRLNLAYCCPILALKVFGTCRSLFPVAVSGFCYRDSPCFPAILTPTLLFFPFHCVLFRAGSHEA